MSVMNRSIATIDRSRDLSRHQAGLAARFLFVRSEGQQNIHYLLAIARLLDIGDLAAATIGQAGLGDLGGFKRVVCLDIFRPDDARDDQFADFEVDADFLLALDHEIAIGQHLRDDGGDIRHQLLGAFDRP